ncbi:Nicotinate phosphoribosyltransferase [Hondaea fermentalgiana]|uniref:Nicotinate phosphoribosyltransferase n=1 Tax=Hondaea fermentalgiana TaxID=2315210 RepID=A0A2R5GCH7_9STRA|nr:Nicotinate phosphoribosyltransferase [Hondaea fermentalgiana]|eukprot:GBG26303.1 Nicotinate phosphoribosyltransferase [Hondaea fermentalgiana]
MSQSDSSSTPTPAGLKLDNLPKKPQPNSPMSRQHGFVPYNSLVTPLLTDMYQVTMCYAYWKANRHEEHAVFELFFRKNPFQGEFTLFCGLEEVLRFVSSFEFSKSDIEYLETVLPNCDPKFLEWLADVDTSKVTLHSMEEGSVVFPRLPLIRVEGPLGICQLLETTLLNLTNFSSLIATNAQRMRLAAGADKKLLEFGLRRAQGPDGAMTASRYACVGGFDGTSNLLAGKLFNVGVAGTHAHAFVSSFRTVADLASTKMGDEEFWEDVEKKREELGFTNTNTSELVAFVAYAQAFPDSFLALVDTYDTLHSGVPNFICVALVLRDKFQRKPVGIRLDSGDLSYLSRQARQMFKKYGLEKAIIVASNDINEDVLQSLSKQGHEIDSFGIGTNLVTCQAQPALGMVYKLVECNGQPCVKLSNEFEKTTLPGKKRVYRLIGKDSVALVDLMKHADEPAPRPGETIRCCHPFVERKRCDVRPSEVIEILKPVFQDSKVLVPMNSVEDARKRVQKQMSILREDHVRSLNPAPYKVSISESYAVFARELWQANQPIELFE